jgi:cell division protein ZapA
MAALIDLNIAGRTYQVACREGEEENLRAAARLVDGKSREALAGLGTLSEARQFLFASLLLADQLIDKGEGTSPAAPPPPAERAPSTPSAPDPALVERAEALANRLEMLAADLEGGASNP